MITKTQKELLKSLTQELEKLNVSTTSSSLIDVASIQKELNGKGKRIAELKIHNKAMGEILKERVNSDCEKLKVELAPLNMIAAVKEISITGISKVEIKIKNVCEDFGRSAIQIEYRIESVYDALAQMNCSKRITVGAYIDIVYNDHDGSKNREKNPRGYDSLEALLKDERVINKIKKMYSDHLSLFI